MVQIPEAAELDVAFGDPSRVLLDAVPVGIVVQGRDAVTIDANRAAVELLGLTLEEMRGFRPGETPWRAYRRDGSPLPTSSCAVVTRSCSARTA